MERELRDHEILKQIGHLRLRVWKRIFNDINECAQAIRRYEMQMKKPTELSLRFIEDNSRSNMALDDINRAIEELEKEADAENISRMAVGQ
jgi:hypothetical protein